MTVSEYQFPILNSMCWVEEIQNKMLQNCAKVTAELIQVELQ